MSRLIIRNCNHCTNEYQAFTVNLRRGMGLFCSMECAHYARGHLPPIDRKCPICGCEYTVAQSRWDDGKGRYCSSECHNVGRKNRQSIRACGCCGKEVNLPQYKIDRDSFFCSRDCFFESRRTGEFVDCEHCGSSFYRKYDQGQQGKGRFCSHNCYHKNCSGKNHHLWQPNKIGRESHEFTHQQRRMILERDKYKCCKCGQGFPNVNLQVDHIIPIADGGMRDLTNGQCLCISCHTEKTTRENAARRKVA